MPARPATRARPTGADRRRRLPQFVPRKDKGATDRGALGRKWALRLGCVLTACRLPSPPRTAVAPCCSARAWRSWWTAAWSTLGPPATRRSRWDDFALASLLQTGPEQYAAARAKGRAWAARRPRRAALATEMRLPEHGRRCCRGTAPLLANGRAPPDRNTASGAHAHRLADRCHRGGERERSRAAKAPRRRHRRVSERGVADTGRRGPGGGPRAARDPGGGAGHLALLCCASTSHGMRLRPARLAASNCQQPFKSRGYRRPAFAAKNGLTPLSGANRLEPIPAQPPILSAAPPPPADRRQVQRHAPPPDRGPSGLFLLELGGAPAGGGEPRGVCGHADDAHHGGLVDPVRG